MLRLTSAVILMSLILFTVPTIFAQVEWTASDQNPVLTPGERGTWDSVAVGASALLKDDREYKFYFSGTRFEVEGFGFQGGCATSEDLLTWKKSVDNPCLPGTPGAWDEEILGITVIRLPLEDPDPEPYKMWYGGAKRPWTANPTSIGFATSDDGLHWNKYSGNPVLQADGAGSWETNSLGWPNVLFDRERSMYRMWYNGLDWHDCDSGRTGYAESADGIHWTKCPTNPIFGPDAYQGNVGKANLLFDGVTGLFEMFYDSSCGGLDYATSLDGKPWTNYPGNPLPIVGEFDTTRAGPVLWDDGAYHMLYRRGNLRNIGYATAPWTLPRASFTLSPEMGLAPLEITADASRSTTPAASIRKYSWDFGDGTLDEGVQANHTYTGAGEYLLMLTVTDSAGAQGSVARKVLVSRQPSFRRGDCNGDGTVSGVVTDAVFMLNFNFLGGPAPPCVAACDADADGAFSGTVTDAVYVLNFNFLGGPPPAAPFPECAASSLATDAALRCGSPPAACSGEHQ